MQRKIIQNMALNLLITGVIGAIGYYLFTDKDVEAAKPYDNMIKVLTVEGLNNKQRFDGLFYEYYQIHQIKGWRIKAIRLKDTYSMYFMEKTNGDSRNILQWPHINQFQLIVDKQGTTLLSSVPPLPPLKTLQVMDINELALYVEDLIHFVMPTAQINYLEDIKQSAHTERTLRLELNNTPLLDLHELGTLLDGLPIAFSQAELLNDQKDLLSGDINILLFGV